MSAALRGQGERGPSPAARLLPRRGPPRAHLAVGLVVLGPPHGSRCGAAAPARPSARPVFSPVGPTASELRAGSWAARRGLRSLALCLSPHHAPGGSGGREAWDGSRRGQRPPASQLPPVPVLLQTFFSDTSCLGRVAGVGGGDRVCGASHGPMAVAAHPVTLEKQNKNQGKREGRTDGRTEKRKERKRDGKRKERGQGSSWALQVHPRPELGP